ncbi:MAG: tRNA glutamyl-Q(34) synthetase GluQRS [Gammaproteobacteria bacterium]|nr:tRNA glutamyl-Q(34) synthetase GluQRS [Gammaproteobacteria bacterium]
MQASLRRPPDAPETTRFAPSPSGRLHLGHALAAMTAARLAQGSGGRFLLRIEDIDTTRCRPEFVAGIIEDLAWLGLRWEQPVLQQSTRLADYRAALAALAARGLAYPCFCTRADIAAEIAAMPAAPQGPEGPLYPGTCRNLPAGQRQQRLAAGEPHAWRLDAGACAAASGGRELWFEETGRGPAGEAGRQNVAPSACGDIVLGRRDVGVSYHLAVVLDDHLQGVTLVTRGEDLFAATPVQRLLQAVLGLEPPRYHHHRLLRDASGRRLAKRDRDLEIAALRARGLAPAAVLALAQGD